MVRMGYRSVNRRIQHTQTKNEAKIDKYLWTKSMTKQETVYEYIGCVFYGHPGCTEEEDGV